MEELTASYFLRAWQDASGSSKPDDGTERERGFALVGPDRLSASYAQTDRAAPQKQMAYYFEISVKNAGAMGRVSVGFASNNSLLHPNCIPGRCGYYRLKKGRAEGEIFCPTVAIGDTVGCGVNYGTKQFIFTKNGVLIGSVRKNEEGAVFPTIGILSLNEEVTVNFGNKPFLFDCKEHMADHRARRKKDIDGMEIARSDGFRMVRSYLQHCGYEETLRLFDMDVETKALVQENGSNEEDGKYALSQRKMIRQMIMRGQVDNAITILKEWFPQIMKNDLSPIRFFLHSQKFIELVRDGKLSEAIILGRNEFDKFRSVLKVKDQVQDCASLLLACELSHQSCVGYLLEESHRELVADLVNATILSTNPNMGDEEFCMQSSPERLIRQLTLCFLLRRTLNMHQSEIFDLHGIMESRKK